MKQSDFGEIVENLLAPEIYATEVPTFAVASGVLTLTLSSSRVDSSTTPHVRKRVVVARVSMPINAAADLATQLYTFLSKHGFPFTTEQEKLRKQ